ncbi:GIY-YIG nuclease family protein [Candidatus Latescibacterota bacterium]
MPFHISPFALYTLTMTQLTDLDVLILDCQATHAHPDKGNLFEIGWAQTRAGTDEILMIDSCLLAQPDGVEIPRQVQRVTGLDNDDLASGCRVETAWKKLTVAAAGTRAMTGRDHCPTVIHFARYELPYLNHLHHLHSLDVPFPFEVICTHEIAKRLLPELPRRGLRSIAGYFGHSVPETRRCGHHVAATAAIWRHIVPVLKERYRVDTIDDLLDWLATTGASARNGRAYPMASEKRLVLPDKPGVYRMLRSNGDVLYVGKATSLKRRVNSYFQKRTTHSEHILEMLSQANDINITETESSLEAALLETDEIKRLSPPYNVALRIRDRQITFSTPDFEHFRSQADATHTIGPLNREEPLNQLPLITRMLAEEAGATSEDLITKTLIIPANYAPDSECFDVGIAEFRVRHSEFLTESPSTGKLTALGARLWLERLKELDRDEEHIEEAGDDGVEEATQSAEWVWTSEAVAHVLESVVRQCAHTIRRARWYCLLSESSLAWSDVDSSALTRKMIEISKGDICSHSSLAVHDTIPVPPCWGETPGKRRRNFDVATYDRMRVLTTEIRRLISENRQVELRVRPNVTLNNDIIARILRWV